jgi:hypothetical protein
MRAINAESIAMPYHTSLIATDTAEACLLRAVGAYGVNKRSAVRQATSGSPALARNGAARRLLG